MSGQPSRRVKRLVRERATPEGDNAARCERCGRNPEGGSYHHRRIKGMGGDPRPDTNEAPNLVLLCGSGTTGCHGWVHTNTDVARAAGWLVSRYADPAETPVKLALHGWAILATDGTWRGASGEDHLG